MHVESENPFLGSLYLKKYIISYFYDGFFIYSWKPWTEVRLWNINIKGIWKAVYINYEDAMVKSQF